MAVKSARDELKRIADEQAKLEKQKEKLREQARGEALQTINAAIEELNALGYSYRLVEGTAKATRSPRVGNGKRRAGIRDEVLAAIASAGPDGIKPAAIRQQIGIDDKAGAQSVANAIQALKRQDKIADKDGSYVAA